VLQLTLYLYWKELTASVLHCGEELMTPKWK